MNIHELNEMGAWEWPDNAGELIAAVLSDKNADLSDRLLAAELISEVLVMDDDIAELMLEMIRDGGEPEELRSQAAIALGPALEYGDMMEFDEPEDIALTEEAYHHIRECLRDIFNDTALPDDVRRSVLEAAVRAPMEWQEKAIQDAYGGDNEKWLVTAVFCMGYVKGFDKQVMEFLDSENPDIFYEAVRAAGNWGIKAAWPYVEPLITSDDTEKALLLEAIRASSTINPEEAVDILMDLSDSKDEDIADAAEDAMTYIAPDMDGPLYEFDDFGDE
jgi:hypothetical protein